MTVCGRMFHPYGNLRLLRPLLALSARIPYTPLDLNLKPGFKRR